MQRYDLVAVTYQVYYTDHEMEKYDEGEWVKHDDAVARIAELEAELAAARDKYVREGIERVLEASRSREGVPDDIVRRTCDDALAAFEEEQQR
jgi:hypothetical protein